MDENSINDDGRECKKISKKSNELHLGIIRMRLESYNTLRQFVRDVRLVFSTKNILPENPRYDIASYLGSFFEERWAQEASRLADLGENAHQVMLITVSEN